MSNSRWKGRWASLPGALSRTPLRPRDANPRDCLHVAGDTDFSPGSGDSYADLQAWFLASECNNHPCNSAAEERDVFVLERSNNPKQGDRIEHIDFVKEKKMKPDAKFYITNQIQNPVAQLFALCIEHLDGYIAPRKSYSTIHKEYLEKFKGDEEDATIATLKEKEKQLDGILFLSSPRFTRQPTLMNYFGKRLS